MTPLKNFNEFVEEGTVKKQYSDLSRAKFLAKESEKSYSFLSSIIKTIGINENSANSIIKLCYDTIMELVRAEMLIHGYKAFGQGSHEAEVSYLREIGFSENEVLFANQLRYFRNSIIYYGKILDKEYANKVIEFMHKIYPKLKKLME